MKNLNHILLNRILVLCYRFDINTSDNIYELGKGNGKEMQQNIKIVLIFIGIFLISIYSMNLYGQGKEEIRYITLPESRLWINGTSNIDSFTCKSHFVKGYAVIEKGLRVNSPSSAKDTVIVSVLVHSLSCGQSMMNSDMYNAMKADKYPVIKYELLNAHLFSMPDSITGWFTINTKGYLFIAGEKNIVNIKIKVKKMADGNYRLVGSSSLSMLNYGITPPSHFFGLIHARNKLIVHFDLIAAKENKIKIFAHENALFAK
jgi:hypothetical protein